MAHDANSPYNAATHEGQSADDAIAHTAVIAAAVAQSAAAMQSAPTWASVYSITTDPGIAGSIFNFNGVPTFSTGFVFRRPGGTDGYIRPNNAGTYNRV